MASSSAEEKPKAAGGFSFRPSKLSTVGEKIGASWASESKGKAAGGDAAAASVFAKALAAETKGKKDEEEKAAEPVTAPASYVFGSNINRRVTAEAKVPEVTGEKKEEKEKADKTPANLFTELAAKAAPSGGVALEESGPSDPAALKASAALLVEKKATAPDEEPTTTGEEGEENRWHSSAKLHQFAAGEERWVERGSGQLRVNGRGPETRLVMRVGGSLRLVLNTKVFGGMLVERLTPKRLRLSGSDPAAPADVCLFLVTCPESESEGLEALLLEAKSACPPAPEGESRKRKPSEPAEVPDTKKSA